MKFNGSEKQTVGVEWELQLLDSTTLDLVDGIMPLMEFFPDNQYVKPEYIQSCVELNSRIATSSSGAVDDLRQLLRLVVRRCNELEMAVCGAGTHPFCRRLALITPSPRYRRMEQETGYLGHHQITFGTHVHVSMPSGDAAMWAMKSLTGLLPVFIAMSANSPFWRGHDTDHAAYRQRILAASRSYGLPPKFESWQDFNDFLETAKSAGMIRSFKDVHWDIRPHPDFGTLEIRVMDAASDLPSLHGLVAFARCLAIRLAEPFPEEWVSSQLPFWIEKDNCFRASRSGLEADFVCNSKGDRRPLRQLALDLIDACQPVAKRLGDEEGLELARQLATGMTGYERQRRVYRARQSARPIVEELCEALSRG